MLPRPPALAIALVLLGCAEETTSKAVDPDCAAKCAAEEAYTCAEESACLDTCARTLAAEGPCHAELVAYGACYGGHLDAASGCYTPDACLVAFGDYLTCVDGVCAQTSCDHPDGTCTCEGDCPGGGVKSVCRGAACDCFIEGAKVGSCTDGSMPICGLKESCCTGLYFLAD